MNEASAWVTAGRDCALWEVPFVIYEQRQYKNRISYGDLCR